MDVPASKTGTTSLDQFLQASAVLCYVGCFILFPYLLSILLIWSLLTQYYWVGLAYIAWYIYDVAISKTSARGGRHQQWLRKSGFMRHFRDYFPMHLIKTVELDPNRNYIFGFHPHGIFSCSLYCNFAGLEFEQLYPGLKSHMLVFPTHLKWPILREYLLCLGMCESSKVSIDWILSPKKQGNVAVVAVGGAAEGLEAHPGNNTLVLNAKKGFVKYAIRNGASLVPVFSFGENNLFNQSHNPHGSQLRRFQEGFVKMMGFTLPMMHSVMPNQLPVHTIIGEPIHVTQNANPSQEEIDSYHERYVKSLTKLFEDHKGNYGILDHVKLNVV